MYVHVCIWKAKSKTVYCCLSKFFWTYVVVACFQLDILFWIGQIVLIYIYIQAMPVKIPFLL